MLDIEEGGVRLIRKNKIVVEIISIIYFIYLFIYLFIFI